MEKKYAFLTLKTDERGVAFIGLNRPEVHNAFDANLIAEFTALFEHLDKDEAVRIAVLFGHGKSFCAGGDLNWMRSMKDYSHQENVIDARKLSKMYTRMRAFSKPLIGVVHGFALGGGSGIAAVCDFVLAAEDARFGFTETRIGILPAVIAPYALEKIGVSAARAYFISGQQFSAQTAKEIGLVHRLSTRDNLDDVRDEVIAEFLKAAPIASKQAKQLIDKIIALGNDTADIAEVSVQAIAKARVGEEGQEGMDALLSGRKAKWVV